MKNKFLKLNIAGFVAVSVIGTLSHFIYEWSGYLTIIGAFCPVNESVWEHLKLIWFPFIIWTIVERFIFKSKGNILPSNLIGGILGLIATLSFHYTYSGIIGKSIMFLDILSFFIGVAVAFITAYLITKSGKLDSTLANNIAIALIIVMSIVFVVFTFTPPLIPLFRDPLTLTYGI